MTNLMCRGRKRGLAGIIATQRLAKLAKNVAAEASNFLMGRTFLDIDMARAADLLGMERRQAEVIRDLERGQFLALGPAVSRRPLNVRIGDVRTQARSASPKLVPLPARMDMGLLLEASKEETPARPAPPPPRPAAELIRSIDEGVQPRPSLPAEPEISPSQREAIVQAALRDIVAEPGSPFQPPAALYQDFMLRCRMRGVSAALDMGGFRKLLACARAGLLGEPGWEEAIAIGEALPEEMLAPFLLIARAAREGSECPPDALLAEAYGTSSTGRVRRLLAYMEEQGILVSRTDLGGKRSVSLPHLGWTTAPAFADPGQPSRLARPARTRSAP
jgi:hypothetical protein